MNQAQALLQAHFDTFVANPEKWKSLISDDIVWELPYAAGLGHPSRLTGRDEVLGHVGWFIGAVEDFRFYDLQINAFADDSKAVAQVKAEGRIKTTGRIYRQAYVLFEEVENGRLKFIREYFDPIQAAHALDEEIKQPTDLF
ncbi:nuclear transport factor 2 family protein [Pseudomonas akapageensis]|uniref:nuclear transport factor 2 family protein n=1 Tax=Pseudomonas akapageensis TaxID=2609961 RepID=UPI001408795E|nr:nuclear transport factor 2 family protein [Pseudomonas akapageensis]